MVTFSLKVNALSPQDTYILFKVVPLHRIPMVNGILDTYILFKVVPLHRIPMVNGILDGHIQFKGKCIISPRHLHSL